MKYPPTRAEVLGFGHLDLFRISIFGFRIWQPDATTLMTISYRHWAATRCAVKLVASAISADLRLCLLERCFPLHLGKLAGSLLVGHAGGQSRYRNVSLLQCGGVRGALLGPV